MEQIALIIPFYNGSEYIEEAIQSAKRQTVPFYEIILVNDGSTASESDYIKSLADTYQLKYIYKENGGQGSARNAGCKIATSEYICFLDQDDILLPEHNHILLESIKMQPEHKRGIVYANFSCAQASGLILSRMTRPNRLIDSENRDIYAFLSEDIFILPSALIMPKSTFFDVGGFDEQFRGYEDDDLCLRIFRRGFHFTFVDKDVYVWRMHKNQTSSSQLMLTSRLSFINKWCDHFYDYTVDMRRVKLSLFKRFKSTIYLDINKAPSLNEYVFARNAAKLFFKKFMDINKLKHSIKYYIVYNFPLVIIKYYRGLR